MVKEEKTVKVLAERLQPGLTENERHLLSAAELGDGDLVTKFLESGEVSAEVLDSQGRSALDLAIIGEDESLTSYLMTKVSEQVIHKGLLCSIEHTKTALCELILKNTMYNVTNTDQSNLEIYTNSRITQNGTLNGTQKGKKEKRINGKAKKMLTEALMRASIQNNFQIAQVIMLKGIALQIPHDYFCACEYCIEERQSDYLGFCNRRLDTFRALASPSYISLTEEDPVLACFHLVKKFRRLKQIETEYQKIYDELGEQCEEFTLDLLGECRSSEEVKILLSSPDTCRSLDTNKEQTADEAFPLLLTAMQMGQKQFVAHEKCQAQVSEIWFSGLQAMRYLNRFEYLLLSIPIGITLLPFISIVYVIAPWSKVSELLNSPSTRFLSYTCSYLAFLFLIVLAKLQFKSLFVMLACDVTPLNTYIFIILIFMWIFGWIWEEMKQVGESGIEDYIGSMWNIIDSLVLTFLLASFTLDVVVPIKVAQAFSDNPLSLNVSGEIVNLSVLLHCYDASDDEQQCPSATHSIGVSWESSWVPDPELLSDILFSFGIILSISRISFIMPANETFGTILVSFYRTFTDLMKFCGMFLLILLSFSCGLATIYAAHRCQTSSFQDFKGTVFLLVWSLFGFGPGEAPDLDNDGPMSSLTNNPSRNAYTVYVGYILYGVYVFAALIVLMNLLIAVMSATFEEVQDKRDVEWKFIRTELWLSFIDPGCPVAPPFNIIPTPRSFASIFKFVKSHICVCNGENKPETKEIENQATADHCQLRKDVICSLVRRYILFAEKEKVEEDDDATEDKLRRLIELVASKIDTRLDEVDNRLRSLGERVDGVQKGSDDIFNLQKTDMDLTKTLIGVQERYKDLLNKNWEESRVFYKRKLEEVNEIKEHKVRLITEGKLKEAQLLEEEMSEKLVTEFVPKTTI